MSARDRRLGASRPRSTKSKAAGAVIACAVVLLAGCGGSATDAGAPVIRGGTGDESSSATASPSESPTPSASASTSASTTPSASASDSKSASASASTSATATPQGATVTFFSGYTNGQNAPTQRASTPTALRANDFDDGQHFFAGWSITNGGDVLYADKATYPFAQDVHLYAVWRSPGAPLNIVAKLTGPTTASVTFQAAPKADGTPAATKSYEVAADQGEFGITGTTTVTGPGTYSFDVEPGRRYVFRMGIFNSGIYYNSNEIAVPLPANLKVVRFYATEYPTAGVAGTMARQYASTATALTRNAFTQTDLSFVGWKDGTKYYANEATYAFDKDVNLIGVWLSPGAPFNIVAKLTALTSASVTFQAAPNLDGTPAAVRSYDVSLIRKGVKVEVRKVTGPGTYDFAVQRDYPYQFMVEDQVSNEIVATPSAVVNTITFNANGGSGSLARQSAPKATALTQNADAIKRSGYAFDGWATTPTGSMAYADGATYPFTASATLYARWGCLPLKVTASAERLTKDRAKVKWTASSSESPWTTFTVTTVGGGWPTTVSQSSNTGSKTATGLMPFQSYTFTVKATNEAGCSYTSAQTNQVAAVS